MKLSINTSSFSFNFIGLWLLVMAVMLALFVSIVSGITILLLGTFLLIQKYKYLIPRKSIHVSENIENTLKTLDLEYKRISNTFSTKTTKIIVRNYGFFTTIQFTFDKVYNMQGKYLAKIIAKYQRYK